MKIHYIKLAREFCDAVMFGEKSFEIRYNDRGYQKDDHIKFHAVDEDGFDISHEINRKEYEITYVLSGWGLKDGYVALAIKEIK